MIDSTVRLILLGRFVLAGPDAPIIDWRWSRRRAAAILKLLGLADQHMAHREQIMEALWPELPPSHAANQLYKNLHWLRRAVIDSGLPRPVVAISREIVRLDPVVVVDVDRFRSEARAALAASGDPAKVEAALRAYGGELLPDDGLEEWTIAPRAELQTLWRSLASLRADHLRMRGEDASAAAQLLEILEVEPWDESAHRRLMEIHLAAGERDAALHRFRACREALRREFGVEPGPETQAVARHIIDAQLAKIDDPDSGPVSADLLERLADVQRQTGDVAGSATYGRALGAAGTSAQQGCAVEHPQW